jgi:SAM-dependent methyltransferase
MSAADTCSLYFESMPVALRDTMWRVGASVRPAEFVEAVVETWRTVEIVSDQEVQARFRTSRTWRDYRALLQSLEPPSRVLAVGCGHGLAGRSSAYAASVVREVFPSRTRTSIGRLDLTPYTLAEVRAPYDLVVTHSLLHFLYDPKPVCRLILQMVAPGGVYIMANEPNARFWSNPECVREMNEVGEIEGRRRRFRRLASPARYWSRLRRFAHAGEPQDWIERMNKLLQQRLGLSGDLTPKEIVRIIDPHIPDSYPGEFPMGRDGLNWSELESGPLFGLRLDTVRTSGYVMRDNPDRVPDRWRPMDEKLASLYPLDGCAFSALWRKPL